MRLDDPQIDKNQIIIMKKKKWKNCQEIYDARINFN